MNMIIENIRIDIGESALEHAGNNLFMNRRRTRSFDRQCWCRSGAMHFLCYLIHTYTGAHCAHCTHTHGKMLWSTNHLLTENYIILIADNIALWYELVNLLRPFNFHLIFVCFITCRFSLSLTLSYLSPSFTYLLARWSEGFVLWSIDCFT